MPMKKNRILLVCANPRGTDPLRTAEEDRTLRESIQLSPNSNTFEVETLNAATVDDLRRALLKNKFDVVHFSGHGTRAGLFFEDVNGKRMVPSSNALAELLSRRNVNTVLLNACYSLSVGEITSIGLDFTIASSGPISDPAAIEFTRGFYDAIGAGNSVPDAYEEGLSAARLKSLDIDTILLRRGENHIPPPSSGKESDLDKRHIDTPRTLLGVAIDTSGSMQESIKNRSGTNITRFNSVKESLSDVGAQIRDELVRRSADISDAFNVFVYAFGLRIGNGVADMVSLIRAAQNIDLDKEIEKRKSRYEQEARQKASGYGELAGLARSFGFGHVVDSVAEAAKSSVKERIVGEIADLVLHEAKQLGDVTLTAEGLANLFESSSFKSDDRVIENVVFGLTPMKQAAMEIKNRLDRAGSSQYDHRTLIVISDGDPTDGDPRGLFSSICDSGVTVVGCFVTKEDIADPRALVSSSKPSWSSGAKLMWDISSEIDETGSFARYLLTQGWSIEPKARLFVQVNHSDVLKEFVKIAGSHFTSESVELLPKGR